MSGRADRSVQRARRHWLLRRRVLLFAAIIAALVAAVGSYGYVSSSGSGGGVARVRIVSPPTNVSAGPVSGSMVPVSWAASSIAGGAITPQGYYVTRTDTGNSTSAACGTSPSLLAPGTSCIDGMGGLGSNSSVPDGTYTYTVTAVYNSWSSASSASGPVTVSAAATQLVFTTSARTSVTGQSSGTITVQRENASNGPTTTGTITVNLATSSAGGVFRDTGDTTTITSVQILNGQSSASFTYRDALAGSPLLTASSGSLISAMQTETVNPASTSATVVSTTGSPSVTGQTVTYTGSVSVTAPAAGTPTGNLEFFDGGTPISACGGGMGEPLSDSSAPCSVTYNAVGSHTITVKYLGDANFNISAMSASITQVVQMASTSTMVASSGSPSVAGQQVTYTGTVSVSPLGGGTPTGSIEFFDGGTAITGCGGISGEPLSGLTATCQVTYNTVGSHAITAQYLGDPNYNASAVSSPITQTVNAASPTLSLAGPGNPDQITAGTPITSSSITATLSGSSGSNAGGSITFYEFGPQSSAPATPCTGGTQLGSLVTVTGNSTYNPTVGFTPTLAGNYWLYASFGGDPNDNGATSACPPGTAQEIKVSAAGVNKLVFTTVPSGNPTVSATATIGPYVVQEQDQYGNPVTAGAGGVTLTLTTTSSGTTGHTPFFTTTSGGSSTSAISIASGQTTSGNFYYSDTKAGTPTLTAHNAGITNDGTTSPTIVAAAASQVSITPTPASATASSTTNISLALQLQDQFGNNTTSTGTTTLTLSTSSAKGFFNASSGGSGTLGATASVSFANGVGTATEWYGDETAAGPTITAKNGAATWGTTTATVTAGVATKVSVTPSPSSNTASATTNIRLPLQLQDQFGNNTTSTGTTTLMLSASSAKGFFNASSGGSGTVGATASVSFANGAGTATEWYGDQIAAGPTITAKNGAATWGTTTVTISAAAATTIATVSGTPQSAQVSTAFASPLVALVTDTFGNPVSGVSVTFTAPSTGASGTFAATGCTSNPQTYSCVATTNASGDATSSTFTANGTTGTYNVAASASGTNTVNFSLTNQQLTITSFTRSGASHNASFTGTGASGSNVVTLTVCKVNSFPCSAGNTVATVSTGSSPTNPWTTATAGGNPFSDSTGYFVQATQGSATSAVFSFTFP